MPATSKSRSDSNPNGNGKRSPSSKPRRRKRRSQSSLAALLELAVLTFWGRVILVMLIATGLTAINILVSGNRFDLFFQMTGIELVLLTVVFWIRFMVRKN